MGLPSLFQDLKTDTEMKASIEANGDRICEEFFWGVGGSKNKTKIRSGYAHFKGTDKKGKLVCFQQRADSYEHALFLLDEFLMSVR
jgi:hypothetical protein